MGRIKSAPLFFTTPWELKRRRPSTRAWSSRPCSTANLLFTFKSVSSTYRFSFQDFRSVEVKWKKWGFVLNAGTVCTLSHRRTLSDISATSYWFVRAVMCLVLDKICRQWPFWVELLFALWCQDKHPLFSDAVLQVAERKNRFCRLADGNVLIPNGSEFRSV